MTITVSTPVGNTTTTSIGLLTNEIGSCIALELTDGQITQVGPDDVLFYDVVVDSDITSTTYNLDTVNTLISNDILAYTDVVLTEPIPTVQSSFGGTFVGTVSSNKAVQVINRDISQTTNHLDMLPVTDSAGNLLIIYYRDTEGMSYSLNSGKSSVLISNTNLLYPDEITSYSVQISDSVTASKTILKLFVATLREGIKTFIPGIDTTYQDFVSLDSVSDGTLVGTQPSIDYLFQNYVADETSTYSHINTGFAPIYILGILNYTPNNGCPLITYSRCLKDGLPAFKYCITPLQNQVYVTTYTNGKAQKTLTSVVNTVDLSTSLWPVTSSILSSTNWAILQTDNGVVATKYLDLQQGILPVNLIDISGYSNCYNYINTGQVSSYLVSIKTYSVALNTINNNFIRFCSTTTINSSLLIETISITPPPQSLSLEPYITGTSFFSDPTTGIETIFVTTDSVVWQYFNSAWSIYISNYANVSNTLSAYLSTAVDKNMLLTTTASDIVTYVTGLRGFSIASVPNNTTNFVGFLGSNIGIIQYRYLCINGVLTIKDTTNVPGRVLRQDLFNSYISDLNIPTGTNIVLSCGIKTAVPVRYDTNSNQTYYTYIPNYSVNLPSPIVSTTTEYFDRNNYLVSGENISNFFSHSTYPVFNYFPSDQIVSLVAETTDTLQLKTYIDKEIISDHFQSAFSNFLEDYPLYLFLNTSFGKYIHLYIDHNVKTNIVVSPYAYTLHGTSTYYTPIKAISEVLASEESSYFVSNHMSDGYVSN
jgi:hypothetical protein